MALTILTYGNKILRKRAAPVPKVSAAMKILADDMLAAMYEANGIGLAAPQVGESLRLIVIDVSGDEKKREPRIFFNPEILEMQGKILCEEGCLSVPEVWANVTRAEIITVKAMDREGKSFELKDVTGLLARCIQHEIDHLEGVLFVDKISATDRILNATRLKKMALEAR